MAPSSFARELAQRVVGRDALDAKLILVGLLRKHAGQAGRAVLVGGSLVEWYSGGAYASRDIDLVGPDDALRPLLTAAGFTAVVGGFDHHGLGLIVDANEGPLRPTEHVVEVPFEDLVVPAVTIEDAIVDRLLAAKYWKSDLDWEQAVVLFLTHRQRLDLQTLLEKARMNLAEDFAAHLVASGGPP